MSVISKDQVLKELLPGLQSLLDTELESHAIDVIKGTIKESDEEFVSKKVYLRVVQDYEKKIQKLTDTHDKMLKNNTAMAKLEGMRLAADYVHGMAEELGHSNLLHAVVLALRNMDTPA